MADNLPIKASEHPLASLSIDELSEAQLDEVLSELEKLSIRTPLDYVPHGKQKSFHRAKEKIRFVCGGNRSGKTESGTLESIFHSTGIYPEWYPEEQRLKIPNKGRIVVTDFSKGGTVLEEKLLSWLPKDKILDIKRTMKGAIEKLYIKHASGGTSIVEVLTHEQDDSVFESWSGHWAWFDEPPPRNKFIAMLRGLIDYSGRCWLTLTPISEPWLYDDFIAKADEDVYYINVDISDNPHISPAEIKAFEARLTEDEKEARLRGKFRHLVGRVYKEFDPAIHLLDTKDYKPNANWPVYFVCDPHDRRPHHALWARVDPRGTVYIIDEIQFKGTIKDFSREVMRRELMNKIDPLKVVRILDPNKGETPTAVTGLKLKDEFAKHALYFLTNVNDDIITGHLAVQGRLMYDKTKPIGGANHPSLYFLREKTKECVRQLQSYVWDEWKSSDKSSKEKPKDVNKDFPDCVRYLVMHNPVFYTD